MTLVVWSISSLLYKLYKVHYIVNMLCIFYVYVAFDTIRREQRRTGREHSARIAERCVSFHKRPTILRKFRALPVTSAQRSEVPNGREIKKSAEKKLNKNLTIDNRNSRCLAGRAKTINGLFHSRRGAAYVQSKKYGSGAWSRLHSKFFLACQRRRFLTN